MKFIQTPTPIVDPASLDPLKLPNQRQVFSYTLFSEIPHNSLTALAANINKKIIPFKISREYFK